MQRNKMVTRAQLLGQGRRVNVCKKVITTSFNITVGKNGGSNVPTKIERQGRTFETILRFEVDSISLWCPTSFTSWQTVTKYCNDCF